MSPIEQIRQELLSRKNRILASEPLYINDELITFFNFLNNKPIFKALLHELNQNKPNFQEEIKKIRDANHII